MLCIGYRLSNPLEELTTLSCIGEEPLESGGRREDGKREQGKGEEGGKAEKRMGSRGKGRTNMELTFLRSEMLDAPLCTQRPLCDS